MDRCGAHCPYSRGCVQNELAMWVIPAMESMPIDRHATPIPVMSGVSSFTLSMWLTWRSPRLLAKSGDTLNP
ncbi:hypothetical protein Y032_0033g2647 [Ancylostoma ceylanicum]|uniref:Uncharacterized protein n=1 Tax=Ancylostoma ceylanicum TaxID=53326 RepID=A0A016ULZ8_9BILA|nr:hypothetical protein Y032_0033g2647 [Ancylostoma ceylanicum]